MEFCSSDSENNVNVIKRNNTITEFFDILNQNNLIFKVNWRDLFQNCENFKSILNDSEYEKEDLIIKSIKNHKNLVPDQHNCREESDIKILLRILSKAVEKAKGEGYLKLENLLLKEIKNIFISWFNVKLKKDVSNLLNNSELKMFLPTIKESIYCILEELNDKN